MRDPTLGPADPGWYGNRVFSALNGILHYMSSTTHSIHMIQRFKHKGSKISFSIFYITIILNACAFICGPWEKQLSRFTTENNKLFESIAVFSTNWSRPRLKINYFLDDEYVKWPRQLSRNPLEKNQFEIKIEVDKLDSNNDVIDTITLRRKCTFSKPLFYVYLFPESKQKIKVTMFFAKEVPSNIHFTMNAWDELSKI